MYAVGHRHVGLRGQLWAAILACGGPERAALSHRSAAAVHDLLPTPATLDVTTLGAAHARAGLRVHRATPRPDKDVLLWHAP